MFSFFLHVTYKQLFQFNVLCLPLLFHRLLDILHRPGEVSTFGSTSETLSESLLPPHPTPAIHLKLIQP